MSIKVRLICENEHYYDEVIIDDYINKYSFEYLDNDNYKCKMFINDKGLILNRISDDHQLELHLMDDAYALITSSLGELKFDIKIVDFNFNNDILVIRYLLEDVDRVIEVEF